MKKEKKFYKGYAVVDKDKRGKRRFWKASWSKEGAELELKDYRRDGVFLENEGEVMPCKITLNP